MKLTKSITAILVAAGLLSSCGAEPSMPTEVPTEATEATAVEVDIKSEYTLYLPGDYDSDGKEEAFAINGEFDESDGLYSDVTIYFIDKFGNEATLISDLYGKYTGVVDTGKFKYIVWEATAGGSGSRSYILGCKNTSWSEPEISRKYEWFREENGKFFAETSDFSKGSHDWITHEFAFIEGVREFIDADEASHMQEIDIDYLTKYYWYWGGGDYCEYQFNKDGTYIEYDHQGYLIGEGKYSLKDNVLIFHKEWGDSFAIYADPYVGEGFVVGDDTENIFYYPGSGIEYIGNTGIVCDGTRRPKEKSGYDKILDGDFSYVAGMYETQRGTRFELYANGLWGETPTYEGYEARVEGIGKLPDGSYIWSINDYENGECYGGVACILYPVGVEVVAYDGSIIETDTSRIRFWSGNGDVCDAEHIAYKVED